MLITDRTLDICTPLLHDYSYESLLFELLKPEEFKIKGKDDKTFRKIELDEKDEIWNKYRTAHIAEVFEKISKEASEFYSMVKGREGGKGNEKGQKEFDEMKKALREAKSMKSKSEAFNFHIESCQTLGNVNN
jgi:syntaxin-binding protein 1